MDPKMREWMKQALNPAWRGPDNDQKGGTSMDDGRKANWKMVIIGVIVAAIIIITIANPVAITPEGHVGVKDFFWICFIRYPASRLKACCPVYSCSLYVDANPGDNGKG